MTGEETGPAEEPNPYAPPGEGSLGGDERLSPIGRQRRHAHAGAVWGFTVGMVLGGLVALPVACPGGLIGAGLGAWAGYLVACWTHPIGRTRPAPTGPREHQGPTP
jgi:hypothetical protein